MMRSAPDGKRTSTTNPSHKALIISQFEQKYSMKVTSRSVWMSCASRANGCKTFKEGTFVKGNQMSKVTKGLMNAENETGLADSFASGQAGADDFCASHFDVQNPRMVKLQGILSQPSTTQGVLEIILTHTEFSQDVMSFGVAYQLVGDISDEVNGGNYSSVIDGSGVELLHLMSTIQFDRSKFKLFKSREADEEDVVNGYKIMGSKALSSLVGRYVLAVLLQKGFAKVVNLLDKETKVPMKDVAIIVSTLNSFSFCSEFTPHFIFPLHMLM
jgi:hypothetical protein